MKAKNWIWLAAVMLILLALGSTAAAQESNGAILGTIYNDLNGDGNCVGTGEPGLGGVTVEFRSLVAAIQTALESGSDGSYSYVNAGLGAWQVTVLPGTGWRVTSVASKQVNLTSANPTAIGVDFCVAQGTGSSTGSTGSTDSTGSSGTGAVTMPESGAAVPPWLLVAGLAGLLLLIAGLGLFLRSRRAAA